MDSVERTMTIPTSKKKGGITRKLSKVFKIRSLTGITPDIIVQKIEQENLRNILQDDEKQKLAIMEAFLARLFASISAIKATYSQLQSAQSPYNPDEIQSADEILVSELKKLSELKRCFLKKQFEESSPETTITLAEIEEQKSSIKLFEIMGKKLDSNLKLKESEITFLKEKLEDVNNENRLIQKKLNSSGKIEVIDSIRLSGLSIRHFISFLGKGTKSIKSFVGLLISELESADWDLNVAVKSIEPDVVYWEKSSHKCYTFESFVCREMFDGFNHPEFSVSSKSFVDKEDRKQRSFDRLMELKSVKPMEYLAWKPKSEFSRFCRTKYLRLVHPKMESSFFGNLDQRNMVNAGEFPNTTFFITFAEMAKRIWLLHCLGFSFEHEVSAFQVSSRSRFSEVYMECVNEEGLISSNIEEPQVGFTVVPGFKLGKTVVQSQVYLSLPSMGGEKNIRKTSDVT